MGFDKNVKKSHNLFLLFLAGAKFLDLLKVLVEVLQLTENVMKERGNLLHESYFKYCHSSFLFFLQR